MKLVIFPNSELLENLNLKTELNLNSEFIEKVACKILNKYKPDLIKKSEDNEIHIHFISNNEIQELNKQYRNKDNPTDVLSWSFIDSSLNAYELAGEIYISLETAVKYAERDNQSLLEKVKFLLIHGLLHVFHYDHQTDEEEDDMNAVTNEILSLIK